MRSLARECGFELAGIARAEPLAEDAARERGVHVISLSNFLNYIGYVPQRRLVVPGNNSRLMVQGLQIGGTSFREHIDEDIA